MEIIKYNIEKLGGIESTLSSKLTINQEMEPSLFNYDLRNIEKNMETVNNRAVHPKFFDSQATSQQTLLERLSRNPQQSRFPYGGTFGPSDPKAAGQYTQSMTQNPDLSNYPCKL